VQSSAVAGRLDRRFLIVAGACLTQYTIVGLMFSYGLFFKSFEAEFGWSRTLLSSATSLGFLVMGVLASLGGHLNDRYGPRIVLAVTGTAYGIGYLLLAHIAKPWQLLAIFAVFMALGLATHDVVTLSAVAREFHQRRGLMTAVVKVGTACGQITLPLLAALLIARFEWREALTMLGGGAIVALLIGASLMKRPPVTAGAGAGGGHAGTSLSEARRNRVFWMLCAIHFTYFTALTTIPLHIVIHGMDMGMVRTEAASLLSVMAAASIAGRLTVGRGIDSIGGRRALMICFVPLISSLVLFFFIATPWMLFVAVAVYGFGHGGLYTVMSPTIAEYFGLKSHGAIFGVVVFFGTIGGAVGPILAGGTFDLTNSYAPAFAALAILATAGLTLVMRLPVSGSTPGHRR
jgi:MFS family permease